MKMVPRYPWLFLIILGVISFAACSGQQAPTLTQEPKLERVELVLDPTSTSTSTVIGPTENIEIGTVLVTPTPFSEEVNAGDGASYPAPGYQFPTAGTESGGDAYPSPEQASLPPIKTALEASDPAGVNLVSGKPTLLEFFAFWWTRCQALAPIVHGLEVEYYDRINFVYLDVDDPANESYKDVFGFRYQPQLVLLDGDGQVVQQWIGPITREEFVGAFENILSQ